MRILLVKTSSLGDVIHNLPVISDLRRAFPEARIDWCVEEAFADIVRLHPAIDDVIVVAVRRWRKTLARRTTWREIGEFRRCLRRTPYDAIIDTQGLFKSGLITSQAWGRRYGYAADAAREPLAAHFYDETFVIPRNVHAVERNRWLAGAALNYPIDLPLDYGIEAPVVDLPWLAGERHALLFTGTSRDDKLWDEANWILVAQALVARGLTPVLAAGSARERQRAARIAAAAPGALVAPAIGLRKIAALTGRARLAIGVDTGLVHLASALRVPTIALYMASDPALTGVYGSGFFRNLGARGCAPSVDQVLQLLPAAEQELC